MFCTAKKLGKTIPPRGLFLRRSALGRLAAKVPIVVVVVVVPVVVAVVLVALGYPLAGDARAGPTHAHALFQVRSEPVRLEGPVALRAHALERLLDAARLAEHVKVGVVNQLDNRNTICHSRSFFYFC